jgi:hypothetical protein
MPKYRYIPKEIDAVQFDGNNWLELGQFCGTRRDSGDQWDIPVFNPIGTYLLAFLIPSAKAELWVEKHKKLMGINVGDYIVKTEEGFTAIKSDLFNAMFEEIT